MVVILNPTYEGQKVTVDLGKCSGIKKVKAYLTDQDNDMKGVKVTWGRGVATVHLTSRGLLTIRDL